MSAVLNVSLFVHFFQGSHSVLLHAGSVCTSERNMLVSTTITRFREVKQQFIFENKNERKLLPYYPNCIILTVFLN